MVSQKRDRRFKTASIFDSSSVHGHEDESSSLVETEGFQVVVGSDKPKPLATPGLKAFSQIFDEGGADADALGRDIQAHHFAVRAIHSVRDKPRSATVKLGDQSRQFKGVMKDSSGYDSCAAPIFFKTFSDPSPFTAVLFSNHDRHIK